ncbi:MAG: hypothetical protein J7J51_04730 [Candidatus Omnitrophica bacterium]|nr:hypothetical protein [Candidatus Omnitrophota bacterium]
MMSNKELNWISTHQKELEAYAGKWIAVLGNKMIAIGSSTKEVMRIAKKKGIERLPLVTKIPRKDERMYVL